jgi:hypothetical protein
VNWITDRRAEIPASAKVAGKGCRSVRICWRLARRCVIIDGERAGSRPVKTLWLRMIGAIDALCVLNYTAVAVTP